MSDDQINDVLNLIEAKPDAYFLYRLSDNVAFVNCNVNSMLEISNEPSEDRFYLIYDALHNESIVACVYDVVVDLHVYVRPNHRGKGYLTKALQSVILQHMIEQPSRREVRISIATDEYNPYSAHSLKVARSVGFRKIPEKHVDGEAPRRRHWYIYRPKQAPTNG